MQLDADRARLLSKGRNHADLAEALKKTKKREQQRGRTVHVPSVPIMCPSRSMCPMCTKPTVPSRMQADLS